MVFQNYPVEKKTNGNFQPFLDFALSQMRPVDQSSLAQKGPRGG